MSLTSCYLAVLKIQNQACQQTMNEAEKEFKKMNDRIKEARDAMQVVFKYLCINIWLVSSSIRMSPCIIRQHFFQASYKELIAESQASTNRGMFL